MVNGFGLEIPPRSINPASLTRNHISGKAIDMAIKWSGTSKVKKRMAAWKLLGYKNPSQIYGMAAII